jgi:HK97 family phage prohead protease
MLFQHDPAVPIGKWTVLREDARGLYVEGQLAKGVAKADEIYQLMKTGAIDGLSIGFQTVRARKDPKTGLRHILEADLWEISVVTFPMLPVARVAEVKEYGGAKGGAQAEWPLIAKMKEAAAMMRR